MVRNEIWVATLVGPKDVEKVTGMIQSLSGKVSYLICNINSSIATSTFIEQLRTLAHQVNVKFITPVLRHSSENFDFAEQRNRILQFIPDGATVLSLDADERLDVNSRPNVSMVDANTFGLVTLRSAHTDLHGNLAMVEATACRIFLKTRSSKWRHSIHETILPSDPIGALDYRLINTGILVHHLGYDLEPIELKAKLDRNINGLLKALQTDYDETGSYNYRLLSHLRNALSFLE